MEVARTKLARWHDAVEEMEYGPFQTVLNTFHNHYQTILNFFVNRDTNAFAESFNARLKAFRNQFRVWRISLSSHTGLLNLPPEILTINLYILTLQPEIYIDPKFTFTPKTFLHWPHVLYYTSYILQPYASINHIQKKRPELSVPASSDRWRLPALPLSQYQRRDEV